ncbi:MAG: hypothetical protein K2J78_06005 [Muribaculaceae bacterium]|nr:hypothetical protein [Muribaculaceae bacterium]
MHSVTVTLSVAEMVYDIQNKTYLTGKSRSDGSNHALVAAMQANDDDENANQILRSMSMAFSNLKNKLGEYLDLNVPTASNGLIEAGSNLELSLRMPSNFNLATVDTIAAAAHQYIVSVAVKDWFTITHKSDASEYSVLADASLAVISEAVSKRSRPVRPVPDKAD